MLSSCAPVDWNRLKWILWRKQGIDVKHGTNCIYILEIVFILVTFLWGTAYLQTAFGNKTSHYKRLLVSQEDQFKMYTIGTAFWGQAGMPTKVWVSVDYQDQVHTSFQKRFVEEIISPGVAKSCRACFLGPVSSSESEFWNGFRSPISRHVWNYKFVHSNQVVGIGGQLRMDICAEINILCYVQI